MNEMWRVATCSIEKLRRRLDDFSSSNSLTLNFNELRSLICTRLASLFAESSVTQLLKYENTDPCVLSASLASTRALMSEKDQSNAKDLFIRCEETLEKMRIRREDTVRLEMTERLNRLRRVAHERRVLEATAMKSPPSPPPSSKED